jgi:hypothetical protein
MRWRHIRANLADLRVAPNFVSRSGADIESYNLTEIEYEFELEDEYDWGPIGEQGEANQRGAEFISFISLVTRTIVFVPSIVLVLELELVLVFGFQGETLRQHLIH